MGYSTGARRGLTSAPSTGPSASYPKGFGGGNKKIGLPIGVGHYYNLLTFINTKAYSSEKSRKQVFVQNMLGGIGRGRSMFGQPGIAKVDGIRRNF